MFFDIFFISKYKNFTILGFYKYRRMYNLFYLLGEYSVKGILGYPLNQNYLEILICHSRQEGMIKKSALNLSKGIESF
jgi:hypothetical protein